VIAQAQGKGFERVPLHDKELAKFETFTWLNSQREKDCLVALYYLPSSLYKLLLS